MTINDLRRLYDYGYWANRKLFQVFSRLTPEEFTRDVAGSYGSIRNTMVHVLSAEWGWLSRCGGPDRGPALKADDYPTLESLIARWNTVEADGRRFLAELRDDDLARMAEFVNPRGETWSLTVGEFLQHGANHAVHHRGQVALLLRLLGHAPGNFDLLFYDIEQSAARQ